MWNNPEKDFRKVLQENLKTDSEKDSVFLFQKDEMKSLLPQSQFH